AVRVARVLCLLALIGLSVVVPSGCSSRQSPPSATPPTQTAQPVYPTIEEAAVAAWDIQGPWRGSDENHAPRKEVVDCAATIRLWKSRPELLKKTMVDLNGDGTDDVLLCNANYVDTDGKEQHVWAGVGQWCLWAVIENVDGAWRAVGCGWGSCPPRVQTETTRGWRDLMSNYHLSVSQGVKQFYQFDGTQYRLTKRTDWGSPPKSSDDDSHE
ncbi:MAG TPA: hypothetical protein VMZ92_02710, partial [Planctomycetota bacterium]|nr:hypothetical protein [Planctomycetota bacterium]